MTKPGDRLSFGPFTLDVEGAELRKGSQRVTLRPKCFDVLVYLIEARGRVVPKDELMERVWPDVIVNEPAIGHLSAATLSVI